MAKKYNKKLGAFGEDLAANFLMKKGYKLIEKNWRIVEGEIDLIMKKEQELVFVEVKTRASRTFGFGEDAVSAIKLAKIKNAIEAYLVTAEDDCLPRLDVVVVEISGIVPKFIHYENVLFD
jgi:putative endonuclease